MPSVSPEPAPAAEIESDSGLGVPAAPSVQVPSTSSSPIPSLGLSELATGGDLLSDETGRRNLRASQDRARSSSSPSRCTFQLGTRS